MQSGHLVQSVRMTLLFMMHACQFAADSHVWYFDSGATKHITSHRDLFTSLEFVPHGNTVTYANNASYPVQGVGKIVRSTAANGSSFTLVDALYAYMSFVAVDSNVWYFDSGATKHITSHLMICLPLLNLSLMGI